MSKHKSISRTIHVHKDVVHHRINEEYNESQVLSEVYCKCGYKGSAKIEPLKEKWGSITWEEQKKCPICKTNPDVSLSLSDRFGRSYPDLTKIWDNGDKIAFHICYTTYYYNGKVDKLGGKKQRIVLTFNSKTGFMYLIRNKGIVNWTHVSEGYKMATKVREFFELMQDEKTKENLKKFLKMCLERRGAKYFDFDNYTKKKTLGISELRNIFLILRYPVLQDVLKKQDIVWGAFPKKARKPLLEAKNVNDAYKIIFGLKNKKGIKMFKENGNSSVISMFSNVLEEVESFDYFCNILSEKLREVEENAKHIKSRYLEYDFSGAIKDPIVNEVNTVHLSDLKMNHEDLKGNQLLFLGLKLIKRFYKNESTFIRKLFNTKRTVVEKRTIKTKKYKINTQYKKREAVEFYTLLSIIQDIYRMYARIKEYMPEMEVQYSDDIIHYHDMLTKTDRRIKIKNEKITYSEEELNHYDYEEEKIKIGLAKTTNEIVSSGTKMNICVPSYANSALDKKLYILFVYVKDVPMVCIELGFDDKNIEAKQVKAYSNYKVEETMAKFIAKYFNERKINYKNCHDLNGFEGLEKSKTPRGNKKYLPKIQPRNNANTECELLEEEYGEERNFQLERLLNEQRHRDLHAPIRFGNLGAVEVEEEFLPF